MRLGIVAHEFPPAPGGMQEHAFNLVTALAPMCDITVYTRDAYSTQPYPPHLRVSPCLNNRLSDFNLLSREPIDVFVVLNAGYSPLSRFTTKPVVPYCHGNDFLYPWIRSTPDVLFNLVSNLGRSPFIWRYRSLFNSFNQSLFRYKIKRSLNSTPIIYVNSHYTAARLHQKYPQVATPVRVLPPGIPNRFFDLECTPLPSSVHPRTFHFLTVSRLDVSHRHSKNLHNLIRSLSYIRQHLDFRWTVVGDGNMRPELEKLVSENGLNDRTTFAGNINNVDILPYYDQSDALLLPSLETFGIVYLEAAARGVPSLGRRDSGAADAIKPDVSGILIPDGSVQSISAGVEQLVANADAWDQTEIRTFAEGFRWDSIAAALFNGLRSCVM